MTTAATLVPYVSRINPGRYDRSPDLAAIELRVLAAWNTRRGYHPLKERLARLYQPLADVLGRTPHDRHGCNRTLTLLFEEVRRIGTAYWAWDERRWLNLLNGPDAKGGELSRPYLLAVAYLLAGFSLAHKVEGQPSLAARRSACKPSGW